MRKLKLIPNILTMLLLASTLTLLFLVATIFDISGYLYKTVKDSVGYLKLAYTENTFVWSVIKNNNVKGRKENETTTNF